MSDRQGELDFSAFPNEEGHNEWLAGRQLAVRELAARLGLPVGHEAEVWLRDGTCLRGTLRLQSDFLLIEERKVRHLSLRIGVVGFTSSEIESCVRLD